MKKTALFIFSILLFSGISYSMEMPQRELANDASSSSQFMQGQESFSVEQQKLTWQEGFMCWVGASGFGASLASVVIGIMDNAPIFTTAGVIGLPLTGLAVLAAKLSNDRRCIPVKEQ